MPYEIKANTLTLTYAGVSSLVIDAAALKNQPRLVEEITTVSLFFDNVSEVQQEDFLAVAEIISTFPHTKSFRLSGHKDFNVPSGDINPDFLQNINPLLEAFARCRFQHFEISLECSYLLPVVFMPINTQEMVSLKYKCANFEDAEDALKIKNMFESKLLAMQEHQQLENLESLTLTYSGSPSDNNLEIAITQLGKLKSLELDQWEIINAAEITFITSLLEKLPHLLKLHLSGTNIDNDNLAEQLVAAVHSHPALEYFSHTRRDTGGEDNQKIGVSAMETALVQSEEFMDRLKLKEVRRKLHEEEKEYYKDKDLNSLKEKSLRLVLKNICSNQNPLRGKFSFFPNGNPLTKDLQEEMWSGHLEKMVKANFERVVSYLINRWRSLDASSESPIDIDSFIERHEKLIQNNFKKALEDCSKDTVLEEKPDSDMELLSIEAPFSTHVLLCANGNIDLLCRGIQSFALTDLLLISNEPQTVLGKRKSEEPSEQEPTKALRC
jgi:hypothetical protein